MFETLSAEYRAVVENDGLLKVYNLGDHPFRKTVYRPDGSVEIHTEPTSKAERILVAHMSATPVFAAGYDGKQHYWVDRAAGACRQSDVLLSGRAIGKALWNCGFLLKDIKKILMRCRQHRWDHCPRQAY